MTGEKTWSYFAVPTTEPVYQHASSVHCAGTTLSR